MGIFRSAWLPGQGRSADGASRAMRKLRERRARSLLEGAAARTLGGSLISLAAVVGSDVEDQAGNPVGQLRDVVIRWTEGASHPSVTAIIVRIGKRDVQVGARWIEVSPPLSIRLRSRAAYVRGIQRHPADVRLAHDVLDRQVVDTDGMQVVRPADVYLTEIDGRIDVVGIEVGPRALLRRIGPRRLRARVRPALVIDWATLRSFSPAREDGGFARGRRAELAGQAGAGLALNVAAREMRELRATEVEQALRSSQGESEQPAEGEGAS